MKLEYSILMEIINKKDLVISIPEWDNESIAEAINKVSVCSLEKICEIINTADCSDADRIEQIVSVLELIGLGPFFRFD